MNAIQILSLAYLSKSKPPARVDLRPGLNVICGASETGKSFVLESIDFMLGGDDPLRDITERAGYDRVRMSMRVGTTDLTLQRSTEGGAYVVHRLDDVLQEPKTPGEKLAARNGAKKTKSLSAVLLEHLGLSSLVLRANAAGKTQALSFRTLCKLAIVSEEDIHTHRSPFLTGIPTSATPEYAAVKLLLTGIDDSALIGTYQDDRTVAARAGKIEMLEQLILETREVIDADGTTKNDLQGQLERLNNSIASQSDALDRLHSELHDLLDQRGKAARQLAQVQARIEEIQELQTRFVLLDSHYSSDAARLTAIAESGSLFGGIDAVACPLCGAAAADQHLDSECDGNVEAVVQAAEAEQGKIATLQTELGQTLLSLEEEEHALRNSVDDLERSYVKLNAELTDVGRPTSSAQAAFKDLVSKRSDVTESLSRYNALDSLERRLRSLQAMADEYDSHESSKTSIPSSTMDEFSQRVERILTEWHYPTPMRVAYHEDEHDFHIAGKPRTSSGKGLRAITHAAVSIALLEHCRDNNLPHPGFVILDSPLLAYWEPEGKDDTLAGTDLKEMFYRYLGTKLADAQVIVIENEHPPADVVASANVVVFTKNPKDGRYGFFPVPG